MIQLIEIREPQIEYENGIRRRAGTRNHDSIDSEYLNSTVRSTKKSKSVGSLRSVGVVLAGEKWVTTLGKGACRSTSAACEELMQNVIP